MSTASAATSVTPAARAAWLCRLGESIARHRRIVLAVWLALLVASAALYPHLSASLRAPNYGVSGSESARVAQLVDQRFGGGSGEHDVVVFTSDVLTANRPAYRAAVARVLGQVRTSPGVGRVIGPFAPGAGGLVSSDGHAAVAIVGLAGDASQRAARAAAVQHTVTTALSDSPVGARLTGYSPVSNALGTVEATDAEQAEAIGLPVAFGVLILALGALVAAVVPLVTALLGLLATFGVLGGLIFLVPFDPLLTTVATMIALGIGIDYSLFILSRFREELARRGVTDRRDRENIAAAVGATLASSGRTIAFSGLIVAVSLCSLFVIGAPVFREIAIGIIVVVAAVLATALSLLPALLATLGPAVNRGRLPARMQPADVRAGQAGGWARWARAVMARPILAAVLVVAALGAAAAPVFGINYGIDLGTSSLASTPAGKAQHTLARSFTPGILAPIEVVVTRAPSEVPRLAGALSSDPRVARLTRQPGDGATLLRVIPSVPIDSQAATDLVGHIRSDLTPAVATDGGRVLVGGATAEFVDFAHRTRARFSWVLAIVLATALAFLLAVFRSVVLPLKAVAMNLLATGASLGLLVLVFQYGYGRSLLGFTSTGFIQVYIPVIVFVLLFGLSMDYEVFLISRMRETWLATRDNTTAVADGIAHTARPITAAAAIMVAVFGSFLIAGVLELKQFGFGLAVAIALDATLVRLVLVPALMRLLGRYNWWLPRPPRRRRHAPRVRRAGTG